MSAVGVVGAGRAGLALARALGVAGHAVYVHGRREHTVPPPLVASWGDTVPWLAAVDIVLLAVPDAAIAAAARRLEQVSAKHVVLHLAGPIGIEALAPLRESGAALGAFHPLLGLRGLETPPERFRGAIAALAGDERALATGRDLATALGIVAIPVPGPERARYHAGAVFAANYLVTLAGAAERLMIQAGLPEGVAREGIARLMESSLANVRDAGPSAALTGPIVRGDVGTVERHLEALGDSPEGVLYRALGKETLRLASLSPEVRAKIERLMGGE